MKAGILDGNYNAQGKRFAIVASRWYGEIADALIHCAVETILSKGGSEEAIKIIRIPGCFEIPLTCLEVAKTKKFDAIITLGVLIDGETDHYRLIADQLGQGLIQTSLETGVPVAFGVITCDTLEKAQARAGGDVGNKGEEAALAAIEMVDVLEKIRKDL
jgi:6,7-dimethyl-8-ribityllumazine synthase